MLYVEYLGILIGLHFYNAMVISFAQTLERDAIVKLIKVHIHV